MPSAPSPAPRVGPLWPVTLVALAIGMAVVAGSLLAHGDITGLIKFGDEGAALEITRHVEDEMGREVVAVDALGHDGRFFFVQALDPLHLAPDDHATLLDRPVYRGQRMLFPLLAGAGGLVPAPALPWTMAAVNLAALVLGTIGTARLAGREGASPWWGLAFAANLGMVFEFDITGAGIVAFAAAVWGTLALEEGRDRAAAGWFTAAVLAREVMLLYLAGTLLLRLWRTRRIPWLIGVPPVVAVGGWALYLRMRLDTGDGIDEVQEFGPPFAGMVEAMESWVERPVDLAVVVVLVALVPVLAVRSVRRPSHLGWGALGFAVMAVFLSRQVWWRFFDITRAIAPVITAAVIAVFATERDGPADDAEGGPRPISESSDRSRAAAGTG